MSLSLLQTIYSLLPILTAIATIFLTLLVVRFMYLFSRCGNVHTVSKRTQPCSAMIVLGSGGHTKEMITLLSGMDLTKYTPRTYVVANSDTMSVDKMHTFEKTSGKDKSSCIHLIPRARQVKQSYFTSIFTTLYATLYTLPLVFKTRPDLLLCNGPGTCIPICFWAYLLKFFFVKDVQLIYVESICRVEHLSLSGLILYHLRVADHVLVQWPGLQKLYPRTRYLGRIV